MHMLYKRKKFPSERKEREFFPYINYLKKKIPRRRERFCNKRHEAKSKHALLSESCG